MITLERVRLVLWHYFEDVTVELGNRCLLAGDNGSGKSTIVDAIQYAMAADLRKTRFNAAAGERKGGRDLAGYARCKLGSDTTEYLRGDAVAHVMLEFTDGAGSFSAGACVEAFTDGRITEHFWLARDLHPGSAEIRSERGIPLSYRQFRDRMSGRQAQFFDSKRQYQRELTAKLGVWRRMAEFNPYLEAFTRSVSFTPLVSVDTFVCDYILEDRPVDISAMKANLESYKEAEREAHGAARRISALKRIGAAAAEWRNYRKLMIQQEYLKLAVDRALVDKRKSRAEERVRTQRARLADLERSVAVALAERQDLESRRRDTEAALARDDAHMAYRGLEDRIARLSLEADEAAKKAERYGLLRSQVQAVLGHELSDDLELEAAATESAEHGARKIAGDALRERDEAAASLRELRAEAAELERGLPRYPEAPTLLAAALEAAGIDARILAELCEVSDEAWTDAIEGWLNTLRFAVLVEPERFQEALAIYAGLPRSVGGAFLPNLARMREAKAKPGCLALLVETESPYARIYLDYVLGDVMTADTAALKNYGKAVTAECMSYAGYTASRIREDVYRRRYLGRKARRERADFLRREIERLESALEAIEDRRRRSEEEAELCRRAYRGLLELLNMGDAPGERLRLEAELRLAGEELAAVDTSGFKELQASLSSLSERLKAVNTRLDAFNRHLGESAQALRQAESELAESGPALEAREAALTGYLKSHAEMASDCESYAAERIGSAGSLEELAANYESAAKGIATRSEKVQREYQQLVQAYDRDFNALLPVEIAESGEAEKLLERLEVSELPSYREKISRARRDAEREFKDHFISRLNEFIEEARESFREINETLRSLSFGRDQYRFTLEERSDRRGQIEIVRKAAEISAFEDGLFAQLTDPKEREAAQALFDRILNSDLNSPELRSVCDYRTYFSYDIRIRDAEALDAVTGKPVELSLSKVLREKSGGEVQTPYYVAIAASFYRFMKGRADETVRFVMFDEAFNRMDDERIGKILEFYRDLGLQILTAVPTEKIEAIAPHVDRVNLVIRHGYSAFVREFRSVEAGA